VANQLHKRPNVTFSITIVGMFYVMFCFVL
jgi:hypothetical protein